MGPVHLFIEERTGLQSHTRSRGAHELIKRLQHSVFISNLAPLTRARALHQMANTNNNNTFIIKYIAIWVDNKTKRDNILYLALLCGKYCYCEKRQSCESDVLCWEDDECLGVSECHGTSGQWTCCVWLKSSWPPAPMPAPLELHMPEPETPGEEHQSQCGHLAHPAIRHNCQHIVVELWQSNVCPSVPCPSIIIFLYLF